MTTNLSAFTIIAAATFATIIALDGAAFPTVRANATRPATQQPSVRGFDVEIVPIEALRGPPPEPCAVEVCSTNAASRPQP